MQANIQRLNYMLLEKQSVRFFLISLVGVVFDLAVGTALLFFVTQSTYFACLSGFCSGLVIAYIGHQKFTFGTRTSPLELKRFVTFACCSILIIGIRFAVISIATEAVSITSPIANALLLLIATGVSFVANFVISKVVIFKKHSCG